MEVQNDYVLCLLLYRLHHCGGFVVKIQHVWPFPSKDNPLTPWTPEQQRKYAEDQLKKLPKSPL